MDPARFDVPLFLFESWLTKSGHWSIIFGWVTPGTVSESAKQNGTLFSRRRVKSDWCNLRDGSSKYFRDGSRRTPSSPGSEQQKNQLHAIHTSHRSTETWISRSHLGPPCGALAMTERTRSTSYDSSRSTPPGVAPAKQRLGAVALTRGRSRKAVSLRNPVVAMGLGRMGARWPLLGFDSSGTGRWE